MKKFMVQWWAWILWTLNATPGGQRASVVHMHGSESKLEALSHREPWEQIEPEMSTGEPSCRRRGAHRCDAGGGPRGGTSAVVKLGSSNDHANTPTAVVRRDVR